MTAGAVTLSVEGPVARIVFDRPAARNAMTRPMYDDLHRICDALRPRGDVRVAVLRGAGGASFVAGSDIGIFGDVVTGADGIAYEREMEAHTQALESLPIPTLALMENSIRHMYTTRGPVRVPADLGVHAIKLRTQTVPMHQEVFTALGAAAIVSTGAAERYTAMQSGLIDGLEGGLASVWDAGLMGVAGHVTLTGHMYEYLWLLTNDAFYQSLPLQYRQAVDEGAIIAAGVNNAVSFQDSNSALTKMIDAGKAVYVPTAADLAEWQAIAEPVGRGFIEKEVPAAFVEATVQALERTRARVAARKSSTEGN